MSVTGIIRAYDHTPHMLNTADMPCLFPRIPASTNGIASFLGDNSLDRITLELVILTDPTMQSTAEASYDLVATQIDNLVAALKTEMTNNNQIDGWDVRMDYIDIGESTYYAIVATVIGSN